MLQINNGKVPFFGVKLIGCWSNSAIIGIPSTSAWIRAPHSRCLLSIFIGMLGTIIGFETYNHEKMVKISKLFVEPYVPRVWEHGEKCFVKIAEKSGENGGKCGDSAANEPHIGRFSQCKKMEGWNFNVSRSSWKKFVIAAQCSAIAGQCSVTKNPLKSRFLGGSLLLAKIKLRHQQFSAAALS